MTKNNAQRLIPLGIHLPQGQGVSRELTESFRLAQDGPWVYYLVASWEPQAGAFVRVVPASRRALQRAQMVHFKDLPAEARAALAAALSSDRHYRALRYQQLKLFDATLLGGDLGRRGA